MDHPTRDLYANFPVIHTGPQACLYIEKIQVILEIFHDIVLKSVICVLISNEHLMQIKQSSEKPIYNTDFDIQRAPWKVINFLTYFSSEKKIISIKCCILLKKFRPQRLLNEIFNFYWHYFKPYELHW